MFYGKSQLIQYNIDCTISQPHNLEAQYLIITTGDGWSYNKQYIYLQNSQSKQYQICTVSNTKVLDTGIKFHKIIQSIHCGTNHQLYLCKNGECYGIGINNMCQLGFNFNIQKLTQLTLIDSCVLKCICMPYASLIQKSDGIYSTGVNSYSCIGHLCTDLNIIVGFQLIEFTHTSNNLNIVNVKVGNSYSIFISKENYHYFLGDSNSLTWFEYSDPLKILDTYEIIQSYTGYDEMCFIVQNSDREIGFFTYGPNAFNLYKTNSFASLSKVYRAIGSDNPIIDLLLISNFAKGNEIIILQSV